jgi:AcrR family transcriptional regulator
VGVLAFVDVVDAGAALVADEGFDALSLRNLAARLGVTPMAMYRHVADADSLRNDVVRQLAAGLPHPDADSAPADAYRTWAADTRAALVAVPGFARHLMTHWFEVAEVLAIVEDLLGVAARAGRTGFEAVAAANAVFTFVLMRVDLEAAITAGGALHRRLGRAPASRPLLTAYARFYETAQLDQHFDFGLETLLRGLGLTSSPSILCRCVCAECTCSSREVGGELP